MRMISSLMSSGWAASSSSSWVLLRTPTVPGKEAAARPGGLERQVVRSPWSAQFSGVAGRVRPLNVRHSCTRSVGEDDRDPVEPSQPRWAERRSVRDPRRRRCRARVGVRLRRSNLEHQFEFVQSEWVNKGQFFRGPAGDKDPFVGANNGSDAFTIPQQPIRRRLQGLPAFVVTRGGEYFFFPGLRALRWLPILRPEEHVCNSQRDSWMPGQGEVAFHRNDCERCPTIIPGPGP